MNRRLILPLVVFLAGAIALAAAAILTFSPVRQGQGATSSVGGPFALTTAGWISALMKPRRRTTRRSIH